nr:uncharacterized protein LOC109179560 [Ipomoea trifida]
MAALIPMNNMASQHSGILAGRRNSLVKEIDPEIVLVFQLVDLRVNGSDDPFLEEASTDLLSRELAKLRTGRASVGMLDHIIVESGGVKTLLNRVAAVSVLDPKLDNERLIAPIPPLTKEHMQIEDLTKKYIAEDVC